MQPNVRDTLQPPDLGLDRSPLSLPWPKIRTRSFRSASAASNRSASSASGLLSTASPWPRIVSACRLARTSLRYCIPQWLSGWATVTNSFLERPVSLWVVEALENHGQLSLSWWQGPIPLAALGAGGALEPRTRTSFAREERSKRIPVSQRRQYLLRCAARAGCVNVGPHPCRIFRDIVAFTSSSRVSSRGPGDDTPPLSE
jgi:hypothetical protein